MLSLLHACLPLQRCLWSAGVLFLLAQCDQPEHRHEPQVAVQATSLDRGQVTTYERGRFSSLLTGAGRSWMPTNDEEKELAESLLNRLKASGLERKVAEAVLAEARVMQTEAVLEVVKALLQSSDAEIRAQALMMLDGSETGVVLPLLEQGLADADVEVRRLAMELAWTVQSPMVEKLVSRGLQEGDETIRQTALQVGLRQGGVIAERTLAAGLGSGYEDLGAASLALLENDLGKSRMPLAFGALDHPSAAVREDARDMLFFLFHERFPDRATAASWWEQNHARYDEDLVLKESSVVNQ